MIGIEADIQGLANNRRNDDVFALGGFGGFNGFFTAAPVAPIAPGSGIANPTGVGNGALGNVALFSRGPLGRSLATSQLDWFATVRGRLGYAWDHFLLYATGGVAFRNSDNGDDFGGFGSFGGFGIPSGGSLVGTGFYTNAAAAFAGNLVGPTNTFFLNDSNNNNVGWTVGGGVEWAFALNWTAKIEGLYVAFDRQRNNNTDFCRRRGGRRFQHRRSGYGGPAWLRQPSQSGRLRRGSGGRELQVRHLLRTAVNQSTVEGPATKPGLLL